MYPLSVVLFLLFPAMAILMHGLDDVFGKGNDLKIERRASSLAILLVVGLVLLQSMITKAGLLLILIPRVGAYCARWAGLKLRQFSEAGICEPVSLEDLSHVLVRGSKWPLLAFIFLLTSGYPALFMWQLNVSPFPGLSGGYCKAQTLELLYTIDILFLLSCAASRTDRPFVVMAGMSVLVFTRYCIPVLFPSWLSLESVDPRHALEWIRGGHLPRNVPLVILGFSQFSLPALVMLMMAIHGIVFVYFVAEIMHWRSEDIYCVSRSMSGARQYVTNAWLLDACGYSVHLSIALFTVILVRACLLFAGEVLPDNYGEIRFLMMCATWMFVAVWNGYLAFSDIHEHLRGTSHVARARVATQSFIAGCGEVVKLQTNVLTDLWYLLPATFLLLVFALLVWVTVTI
jgi:hypothetical protein